MKMDWFGISQWAVGTNEFLVWQRHPFSGIVGVVLLPIVMQACY